MCSFGEVDFFSAPPGTAPMYKEKENRMRKRKSSKYGYKKTAIIGILMLIAVNIIGYLLGNRVDSVIKRIVMIIIVTLAVS